MKIKIHETSDQNGIKHYCAIIDEGKVYVPYMQSKPALLKRVKVIKEELKNGTYTNYIQLF
jgi:hypothetical protein